MSINFQQDGSVQLSYSNLSYTATPVDNYATSNYVNSFWTKNATNNLYLANITTNVGIGTTNPLYQLYIFNPSYNSKPLLLINAGTRAPPYSGTARNIGEPLLGIGGDGFGAPGDYCGIGLGYCFDPGHKYPCEIGCKITNNNQAQCGDILFSTRTSTSQFVAATERMRLTTSGNLALGLGIDNTTYKLNVDGSINCTSLYQNGTSINTNISTAQTNNSNYTDNVAYVLNSRIDSKQNILAPATTLLGNGNAITNINYNTIINKPTYSSPLTSNIITNQIGIDLSAYSTTGNDVNYVLKSGSSMSGPISNTSTTASGFRYLTITHIDTRLSHLPYSDNKFYLRGNVVIDGPTDTLSLGSKVQDNILLLYGTDYGLGINSGTLRYNVPSAAVHKFYSGTTNTATIGATGIITAPAFSGDGSAITNVAYANISGKPTNFQSDWTSTVINKPTYFAIDPAVYYTQTQTNTAISTANNNTSNYVSTKFLPLTSGILTGNLTVPNITLGGSSGKINVVDDYHYIDFNQSIDTTTIQEYGTIKFNIGATKTTKAYVNSSGLTATAFIGDGSGITNIPYTTITGKPTNFQSDWTSTVINKPTYFAIDPAVYYTQTQTNTAISTANNNTSNYVSTKFLPLTGGVLSSDLTGTTITAPKINCSDATGVDATTLARNLNIVGTNAVIRIWRSNTTGNPSMEWMAGPTTSVASYVWFWDMYIGTATEANYFAIRDRRTGGGSPIRFLIDTNGNIGISTTTPSSKLTINNIVSDRGLFDHSASPLTVTHQTPTSTAAINDPLPILHLCRQGTNAQAYGARATFNLCRYEINSTNSRSRLDISLANAGYDDINIMSIRSDGRVGIGTTAPIQQLHIRGTTPCMLRVETNNSAVSEVSGIEFGIPAFPSNGSAKILSTAIAGNNADLQFYTSTSLTTSSKMTITPDGNVGIGTTNPVSTLEVAGKANIHNGSRVGSAFMQSGSLTIGGTNANYGGQYYTSGNWTGTNTAGLLMECDTNTEIAVHDSATRLASLMYYEGNATNRITIGRDMGWGTTTSLLIPGATTISNNLSCSTLQIGGSDCFYYLFNNTGGIHGDMSGDFNNVGNFGCKFVNGAVNGPGTTSTYNQWYTMSMGLGANYNFNQFVCQLAIPRNTGNPTLSIRFKEIGAWGGWTGIAADTLTSGNKNLYGDLTVNGTLTATFLSVSSTNTDYCGIQIDTVLGSGYTYPLRVLRNTFTGLHRCFIDNEELFDINDIQKFKDDYVGRIVIASGKVATDTSDKEGNWEIKYDKNGITIEDAVPMIQLSRTKKDKRVFGVLGDPKRSNTRAERMIVNSVGEGGIMIINSNGNIENGDYIQSSGILGYGEKQDDDLLHNYTVAKATIDCDFELDSPLYQCFEIDEYANGNKLRIAFISCTYHAG